MGNGLGEGLRDGLGEDLGDGLGEDLGDGLGEGLGESLGDGPGGGAGGGAGGGPCACTSLCITRAAPFGPCSSQVCVVQALAVSLLCSAVSYRACASV